MQKIANNTTRKFDAHCCGNVLRAEIIVIVVFLDAWAIFKAFNEAVCKNGTVAVAELSEKPDTSEILFLSKGNFKN